MDHFLEEDNDGCFLCEGGDEGVEMLERGFHSLVSVGFLEINVPCEELDW